MNLYINQHRTYHAEFTESSLHLPDRGFFCWVLEDIGRPEGVKISGATCIPECILDVSITRSERWDKDMLILHNTKDYAIERNGVRFTGVRPHGGNDISDTDACPLVAYHSNHNGIVWQRASDDLFTYVKDMIKDGYSVKWVISS